MSKSKQTRDIAKAMVSPLFAWSNAVLKSGEMMLDSMQSAAKNVRVAVLPELDAQPRKRARTGGAKRAKRARQRRR
jgi:hypothetical protein